jgi:hypothetical protein
MLWANLVYYIILSNTVHTVKVESVRHALSNRKTGGSSTSPAAQGFNQLDPIGSSTDHPFGSDFEA